MKPGDLVLTPTGDTALIVEVTEEYRRTELVTRYTLLISGYSSLHEWVDIGTTRTIIPFSQERPDIQPRVA